jgi:hypothetical protein|tara:strand:+ start:295 stop:990 length:696 start_codon:yes stop_codon:yes gene_type:complete
MAKISTYDLDSTVSKNDKVIGTDSSGSSTKNFKLEDIAGFLNTSSLLSINGQIAYQFKTQSTPNAGQFNISTGGAGAFSSISSLIFSYLNTNDQTVQTYLNSLNGTDIIISQSDNPNNFGIFGVSNISAGGEGQNYSTFTVSFKEGNGTIVADKYYLVSISSKFGDKNFVSNTISFSANSAQTISHNLNKFPSVTTIDSSGNEVFGDIQHININSFTITFTSSFSGKVHVN